MSHITDSVLFCSSQSLAFGHEITLFTYVNTYVFNYEWKVNWSFDPGEGTFERVSAEREENWAAWGEHNTLRAAWQDTLS